MTETSGFITDPSVVLEGRWDDYEEFLRTYYRDEIAELYQRYPREQTSLVIDWSDILQWDVDVADDLREHPELFKVVFERVLPNVDMPMDVNIEDAEVRFTGTPNPLTVSELRGEHAEKFIGVKGQVTKTSEILPKLTVAHFRCKSCGGTFDVHQPKTGVEKPPRCKMMDCNGQRFDVVFDGSQFVDHQLIRVKEPPEEGDGDGYVDVILTGDATGSVQAGDRADVFGILETDFGEFESAIPDFYIDGHNVERHESDYDEIDIGGERETFEEIADGEHGDPYEMLIGSIAPSIKGGEKMENIKLAIGLQLFGGWRRPLGDGRYARGDSHIALIGDPGTGKSSLLEAAEEISPRSSYTSGKNTSAAGLTASAVRDDFGDTEWSLEAGVIVKAHKGIACVDEIDKVDPDAVSSLHTALERQRLEVTKAGIDASLKCHTALLAAGNPKEGRFVDDIHRGDQINLLPALASRFDVIFTLEDVPDKERDAEMAEHIMKTRQLSGLLDRGDITAAEADLIEPAIPKETLRAYIAYACQHIKPVVKDDAVNEAVSNYFVNIRDEGEGKTVPITPRKLEAIQRFAEASARVRLSEEITLEDFNRAKAVIGQSLGDIGINEHGELDGDIVETGQSAPQGDRIREIIDVLRASKRSLSVEEIENKIDLNASASQIEYDLEKLADKRESDVHRVSDGEYIA